MPRLHPSHRKPTLTRFPLLLILTAALALAPVATSAQDAADSLVAEARRERDAGGFEVAASMVERYLAMRPGDAGAWWMLAQLRYWTGNAGAALRAFERASDLAPADDALRLDFANTALGLGHMARARGLASPLLASPDPETRAAAEGVLAAVRRASAPWVVARAALGHDDQPRTALEANAEVGFFPTPAWTLALALAPRRIGDFGGGNGGGAGTGGAVTSRADARLNALWTRPGGALSLGGGGGAVLTNDGARALYQARASLGVRRGLTLRAEAGRAPYEWTLSSLDSVVMTRSFEVALDGAGGARWAGAAAWRHDAFADANHVRTAYGWLLAPLGSALRAGYAFSWQDAAASRWVRDGGRGPVPREPGRADTIPGHYAPYHTPDDLVTHSLLADAGITLGATRLRAQGSFGVHARERAPVLVAGPGTGADAPLLLTSYVRAFHPWQGALTLSRSVTGTLDLEARAEMREAAYYRYSRVSVLLYRRFP